MNEENLVYPNFENDLQQARQLNEQMLQQRPQAALPLIKLCKHILARIQPEAFPEIYALIKTQLGCAFIFLPGEDHAANLKQAIALFQEALPIWTLKAHPEMYANTQNDLGNAYSSLLTEDREANLKRAILCYEEALRVWTPKTHPDDYASVQNNLGLVYFDMPTKDREANLKRAIACFHEALYFVTPQKSLRSYILLQTHMGSAYTHLQRDRANNLKRAIDHFNEALRIVTPETMPRDYAMVQLNLGVAYIQLTTGNIAENIEHAFTCFQESSRFCTPETGSSEYVMLQTNLGIAYNLLRTGDRTAHLKQAIACFQEVLRFWTPTTAPLDYAIAQMNLGLTYSNLPTTNRVDNLKQAIVCYEEALHFLTPREMPRDYARTQMSLGGACSHLSTNRNLPTKDRIANVKRAIACFQEALRFCSPQTAPVEYADAQNNLGAAYMGYAKLTEEDRATNLEQAITCYHEALRFRTSESAPDEYAATQNNLGATYATYSNFSTGEIRATNLERAIACYHEALRFRTPETAPLDCRNTGLNLATLYFWQEDWQEALDASLLAIRAGERLYQASFSNEGKAIELRDNAFLYQRAAFSAIQCGKITEGLLLLEQGKTRILIETLRLRIERPAGVPDKVWQMFENAGTALRTTQAEELITAENTHSFMQDYQRHERSMQAYREYEQKMHALNIALDAAISQVRLYTPDFLKELDWQHLQSLLSESQKALITFCITEQGSIGIIMSSQDQQIEVVEIKAFTLADLNRLFSGGNDEEQTTGGWLGAYHRFQSTDNQQARNGWEETMTNTLEVLGRSLLAPVLSRLPANIIQLTFLPSAQLFLFPLHAAPLSENVNVKDRVCDRYQVSYAPSMDVLIMTKARASREVVPSLYAVINPTSHDKLIFTLFEGQAITNLFDHHQMDKGRKGTKESCGRDLR